MLGMGLMEWDYVLGRFKERSTECTILTKFINGLNFWNTLTFTFLTKTQNCVEWTMIGVSSFSEQKGNDIILNSSCVFISIVSARGLK